MKFEEAIKTHLEQRAKEDSLFAVSFAKPNKSITECCSYILGEARKRGNAVAVSDEEVYGMAVHYYDEDDIKVAKVPASVKASVSTSASLELTETDEDIARRAALRRLEDEQYALLKKKSAKAKKKDAEVQQMNLFL